MTDKETRGLFQGETTSFSLGDVQHFEKHWFVGDDRARVPYRGIQIITCHTKWNFEHDIWENNIYLSRDEAEKFIKQWSDEHEQNPSAINIIFDSGGPDMKFIEVETDQGAGINVGEWIKPGEAGGYYKLRITGDDLRGSYGR